MFREVYVGFIGLAFGLLPHAEVSELIRLGEFYSQSVYVCGRDICDWYGLHFENVCAVRGSLPAKMHLSDRLHAIDHFGQHLALLQLLITFTILFLDQLLLKAVSFFEIVLHHVHRLSGLPEKNVVGLITEVRESI